MSGQDDIPAEARQIIRGFLARGFPHRSLDEACLAAERDWEIEAERLLTLEAYAYLDRWNAKTPEQRLNEELDADERRELADDRWAERQRSRSRLGRMGDATSAGRT